MKFEFKFVRNKGATDANKVLGSDTLPATGPGANMDNVIQGKCVSINGFPVERLAIGYFAAGGGAVALKCDLYMWDTGTSQWFHLGAQLSLAQGAITFADVIAAMDHRSGQPAGGYEIALIVTDPGTAPNGDHTIVVAPDMASWGS